MKILLILFLLKIVSGTIPQGDLQVPPTPDGIAILTNKNLQDLLSNILKPLGLFQYMPPLEGVVGFITDNWCITNAESVRNPQNNNELQQTLLLNNFYANIIKSDGTIISTKVVQGATHRNFSANNYTLIALRTQDSITTAYSIPSDLSSVCKNTFDFYSVKGNTNYNIYKTSISSAAQDSYCMNSNTTFNATTQACMGLPGGPAFCKLDGNGVHSCRDNTTIITGIVNKVVKGDPYNSDSCGPGIIDLVIKLPGETNEEYVNRAYCVNGLC